MLDIIQHNAKARPKEDEHHSMVRVTNDVLAYLSKTDHVVTTKTEKGANYLKLGRKREPRKPAVRTKLTLNIETGAISK